METRHRAYSLCLPSFPAAHIFERLFFLRKFTRGTSLSQSVERVTQSSIHESEPHLGYRDYLKIKYFLKR